MKRYYLIRTPDHARMRKGATIYGPGYHRTSKRDAVSTAKFMAKAYGAESGGPRARRISVYVVDPGKRPSLLFQAHYSRKLSRIVVEEL